jgi:AraC-like DNA-binding protein
MLQGIEVSAGMAASILKCAAERGVDAAPIARACGLDPADFSEVGKRVNLADLCRLLETLAALTSDPYFGLHAGASFEKGASGVLGYALMHAPTGRHAVELIRDCFPKADRATRYSFQQTDSETRIEWKLSPLLVRRGQYTDLAYAAVIAHFRTILGPGFKRVRTEIETERPKNPNVYKELIGPNISFGAPANAVTIPNDELGRVNPDADPKLFAILRSQLDSLPELDGHGRETVQGIRNIVEHALGGPLPSLSQLSERMGMSERTLQRRLAEAGSSLHEIIDDSRRDLARQLLTETDLTLSQISDRLGFSAPSAFTRSASRWFGTSPSKFRRG